MKTIASALAATMLILSPVGVSGSAQAAPAASAITAAVPQDGNPAIQQVRHERRVARYERRMRHERRVRHERRQVRRCSSPYHCSYVYIVVPVYYSVPIWYSAPIYYYHHW